MTYDEMIKHMNKMLMSVDYEYTQAAWAYISKLCEDSEYQNSHIDYIYSDTDAFDPNWTITLGNDEILE